MYLSEETPLVIERFGEALAAGEQPRWQTIRLGVIARLGLALRAGDAVVFPPLRAAAGDVCLITAGPPRLDIDDVPTFEVRWRPCTGDATSGRTRVLGRFDLDAIDRDEPWRSYQFPLGPAGRRGSIVVAARRGWRFWRAPSDIVLYELVIGDRASLDLERARSFRAHRIRNERANFDAYYQHAVFELKEGEVGAPTAAPAAHPLPGEPEATIAASPDRPSPEPSSTKRQQPPEPAFLYSRSRLGKKIALDPPPFHQRLRARVDAAVAQRNSTGRPTVRVLSLCSGAARIEADLVRDFSCDVVSLTLLDVNPDLLDVARRRLSSWGSVDTIVADLNELDLADRQFDVILCVSGLHHVVELERVIGQVAGALTDTGEFWSIGETLGRNGGRMWPEAYAAANRFFIELEDKYRLNRMTGVVDKRLPDIDYSIGCFEGIRCEAIEPTLLRYLEPVHTSKHCCIIHKLFSLSYSDNYDMALDKNRALVDAAVDLDVALHAEGRFGVELNGVYRAR